MRGLFIGIGGTGDKILARLKDKVYTTCAEIPKELKFFLFDTEGKTEREKSAARLAGENKAMAIKGNEYLQLKGDLNKQTDLIINNPDQYPEMNIWYKAKKLREEISASIFNLEKGAGRYRQISRMAIFMNQVRVMNLLRDAIKHYNDGEQVTIWIVGSVAGGTGAGLFMDVALMVRHLSEEANVTCNIIGAAVLSDVFMGADIIDASAYAVLREINRFQATVHPDHCGRIGNQNLVRFSVQYGTNICIPLTKPLFDNLVFYNRKCNSDPERDSYYSHIADGFNLLLDQAVGSKIHSIWINLSSKWVESLSRSHNQSNDGMVTSFNTHSIFVPSWLYKRQFILDGIEEVVDGLYFPEGGDGSSAPSDDQRNDASSILKTELLIGFTKLAAVNSENDLRLFSDHMSASYIVTDMLELTIKNAPEEDNEKATKRLVDDIFANVETARGNTEESFDQSKERFKKEVEDLKNAYKGDGTNSFRQALGAIEKEVEHQFKKKIDNSIRSRLGKRSAKEKTLNFTLQVLGQLKSLIKDLDKKLKSITNEDAKNKRNAEIAEIGKLNELDKSKLNRLFPWFWRNNLAAAQEDYRKAANAVNQQFQREELVASLFRLIDIGVAHVGLWEEGLKAWVDALIKAKERAENEGKKIAQQLDLQTNIDCASMGLDNKVDMGGYREHLKKDCLKGPLKDDPSFVDMLLNDLKWEAGNPPQNLVLMWPAGDSTKTSVNINNFYDRLHGHLESKIAPQVKKFEGITHYLKWLKKNDRKPVELAERLQRVTYDFLDNKNTAETRQTFLLYGDLWDENKDGENEFKNIAKELCNSPNIPTEKFKDNIVDDTTGHPLFRDKNVLAVLMMDNGINYQDIEVFGRLRSEYIDVRNKDNPGWRAETYHVFRCDEEARVIERKQVLKESEENFPEIPGDLARLLDDPKLSKLFGVALVSGVIREVELARGDKCWACGKADENNIDRLILLNNPDADDEPRDLLRAFVTFVMDKQDRRPNRTGKLDQANIDRWIDAQLKESSKKLKQMAQEYREAHPKRFEIRLDKDKPAIGPDTFLALVLNHYLADLLDTER